MKKNRSGIAAANRFHVAAALIAAVAALTLSGCAGQGGTPVQSEETAAGEAQNAAGGSKTTAGGTAAGNTAQNGTEALGQTASGEKLKVMASFYPMYDFAVKVGGDRVEVTDMVPAGTEPHDWEPSPTDIVKLEKADVFVYSGAGMESWTDAVLASLDNKKLVTVEASKGAVLLDSHEEDEHAKEAEQSAGKAQQTKSGDETSAVETVQANGAETEEHTDADEHDHDHGAYDPHVWLDPENAKKEMENIKNAFVQADPANSDYYESNYESWAAKFDALDQKFADTLEPLPNKDIVVAHEAFGYLCNAYGLTQVGIEGLTPDSEPDPARMAEIVDFVKKNNVKVIFFEELVSPKVAQTVAKETGAQTQMLNPLEGLSDEDIAAGADYFSVMEENLQQLKAALE